MDPSSFRNNDIVEDVAVDHGGAVHRVHVERNGNTGQFVALTWACSRSRMTGIAATYLSPGRAITCLECLAVSR